MTLHDAELALTATHHVLRCHDKRPAVNGEADQLAIHSDAGYVLINCQAGVDFYALAAACPDVMDLTRVKTPAGFHLYYQGEAQAPQVLATNRDGSPRITVTEYAVTYPTPGYALESGLLTQIPAKPLEFWRKFKAIAAFQTVKPERIVPIPGPVGDAPAVEPPPLDAQPPDDIVGALGMMTMTERNAAAGFEMVYSEQFRYCKAWKTWLDWDCSRWVPEGTDKPFDAMVRMVHSLNREMNKSVAKSSFSAGAEKIARASRKFATKPEDWDRDTWLLNTPAGTIDLKSGDLRPHRKDDLISKVTAVAPSELPRPVFDRFLKDITLEDPLEAGYLQRSLGACLSGAQSEPFILFWFGNGAAGKNTLWDLVRWLMGGYAKTVPIDTLLSRRDDRGFETLAANLLSLRLAISSEVPEGAFFDEQKLKSLSGDATIPGRFLYGSHFDFPKTHKHLIVGNDAPQLRVVDNALKRRLHVVPFRANFEGTPDLEMPAKLRAEGPQILQWLIEGHALWLEDGMLRKPSCVQEATDKYFTSQSTPAMWIEECCNEDSDARATAKGLYLSYKTWKESRGEGAISQTRLGEYLSKRYDKIKSNGQIQYQGLELKPSSVLDFQA